MSSHTSGPIDPIRLREVLDGPWAEVRDAYRDQLDARFLPVYGENDDQARERVSRLLTDLPVELGVASAFPSAYGGRSDVGASIVASEMLAQVDLSLMVKAGVQWGLFGGAVAALGTRRHHDAYLRDIIAAKILRLLRDDRDRPRLRRPAAAHHLHVRPADADLRPAHAARGGPQGLHRQRGPRRADGGGLRAADHAGPAARRARVAGPDPRRAGQPAARRDHRRRGTQGRPARRGQRPAQLRPRAGAAGHAAGPLRPGRGGRHVLQPDRQRLPALLHHARHPGQGPGQRGRRRVGGHQVGADHRRALRRHPPPVQHTRRRPGGPAQRLPGPPAQAAARPGHHVRATTSPRPSWSPRWTRCRATTARSTSTGSGSWSPGPPASRPPRPGTPPAPSRRAARRAAAPATWPRTGCPASRPTPTSSPPSRATTRCCCSWWPRGCSPATGTSSARWTVGGGPPSSPNRFGR